MVMPDIEPFVSPVDGRIVTGRAALREHNKRNNVTNVADYKNQWESQAREREQSHIPGAGYDRKNRIEAIKYAIEKHTKR